MNEQQLRYFMKVAEKQNLTLAAQELILSPPALTATLRRLEKELGCQLFDHSGRSIILNTRGQILLRYAKTALQALDAAREEIALAQQHSDSHLTIGLASPLICHDLLKAFLELHPQIQLTHQVLRIHQLKSPTLKQEVDFIISSKEDIPLPGWEEQLIKTNNYLVLAVYPSHPLATRSSIRLDELSNERLIMIPREYCFRQYLDNVFAQAAFCPNMILECDFAMRPTLLNAQYGVALISETVKGTGFSPDTVFIPVTEPKIDHPWHIFKNRNSMKSRAANLFWDFAVSFYQQDRIG